MHGASSWTREGGDEEERCRKAFEKKNAGSSVQFFLHSSAFCSKNGIS